MATKKSIIPEFMKDNPDDTFQFLFPLKIVLDEDNFANSHYEVVVKNMSKNQIFTYRVSPELLFTHYPLCKSFKNGEKTEKYLNKDILKLTLNLLKRTMREMKIGSLDSYRI